MDGIVPTQVIDNVRIVQISAGGSHCAALAKSGELLTSGTGATGGNVLTTVRYDDGALAGDVRVVFVACGSTTRWR